MYIKCGNRYRLATVSEICEQASAYTFEQSATARVSLSSPLAAREFIKHQAGLDHEQFGLVHLDTRHRVLRVEILSRGTIDGASVHPREVVKSVLVNGTAGVILFHNHPSGNSEPSTADETITTRLKDALALIDVRLLDHLIVTPGTVLSMAERGLI